MELRPADWLARFDRSIENIAPTVLSPAPTLEAAVGALAPWGPLPPAAERDLLDWWAWVEAINARVADRPADVLVDLPCGLPLTRAYAIGFATTMLRLGQQIGYDGLWKASYVPLTGDQDEAWVVDLADPELPVVEWFLELPERLVVGYGIRHIGEVTADLIDAGVIGRGEGASTWFRTSAPIPSSVDPRHRLLSGRYLSASDD